MQLTTPLHDTRQQFASCKGKSPTLALLWPPDNPARDKCEAAREFVGDVLLRGKAVANGN